MPSVSSLLDSGNNNEQISNTTSGSSSTTMQPQDVGRVTQQIIDSQEVPKKKIKPPKGTPVEKVMKPQDFDLGVAQIVYRGVQSILEKDEFDLFATKSSKVYDLKIAKINTGIEMPF